MFSITDKKRFDDVADENTDGSVDYEYRGYNYEISNGARLFFVRTYDDELGVFSVLNPASPRSDLAHELVAFLVSELGAEQVQFYCSARENTLQ